MEEYEEKAKILIHLCTKLSVLEERIENGFNGVNKRLDTANGILEKHEDRIDILEKPKRIDFRMIGLGLLIGAFVVAAGMTLRDILEVVK